MLGICFGKMVIPQCVRLEIQVVAVFLRPQRRFNGQQARVRHRDDEEAVGHAVHRRRRALHRGVGRRGAFMGHVVAGVERLCVELDGVGQVESFEKIDEINNINQLVKSGFYKRVSESEKYLFDQKIPILIDNSLQFKIDGFVKKFPGFREYKANLKNVRGNVERGI